MSACATEHLKGLNKKKRSCAVDTDVVVLVIDMAKKKNCLSKCLFDEMTTLTKVALYQHILKAAYQGSCVWVSARTGGNDYQVQQTVMDRTRHWNVQSIMDHHTLSINICS